TDRGAVATLTWEILKSDGTPIGTIVANGLTAGGVPPGSPLTATGGGGNFVITGGTGAFLGARGQMVGPAQPPGGALQRGAYMTEDPANRRPQWRRNTRMDSLFNTDVGATNFDHCQRPSGDPFQRLLFCYLLEARCGRRGLISVCDRARPDGARSRSWA